MEKLTREQFTKDLGTSFGSVQGTLVHLHRMLDGLPASSPFWQMLQHMVNHGSYHRGQVTTLLRQLGAAPAKSTDLIAFFRLNVEPRT